MSRDRPRKLNETWKADELTDTITRYKDERRPSKHRSSNDDRKRRSDKDQDPKRSHTERSKHSSRRTEEENGHKSSRRRDDGYEDERENRRREKLNEKDSRRHDDGRDHKRRDDGHDSRRREDKDSRRRDDERSSRRKDEERSSRRRDDDRESTRKEERETKRRETDSHRKRESEKDSRRDSKRREDRDDGRRNKRKENHDDESKPRRDRRNDSRERRNESKYDDRRSRHKEDGEEYDKKKERKSRRHENDDHKHRSEDKRSKQRREDDKDKDERRERRHDKERKEKENYDKKSHRRNKSPEEIKNHHKEKLEEEDAYDYEDEEFEEYDSDFEDDVGSDEGPKVLSHIHANSEISELARAIEEENVRAASRQNSRYGSASTVERNLSPESTDGFAHKNKDNDGNTDVDSQHSSPVPFINFKAASKKAANSKVQSGMLKRFKDLRSIITLDVAAYDIFDMEPVTEYNIYIKNFGNRNTNQIATQCNEDNLEQEIQTDEPETNEKWSQHPPTDVRVCGDGIDKGDNDDYNKRMMAAMQADAKRFSKFMVSSCKLVQNIIAEETAWVSSLENKNQSSYSFCESYNKIQTNLGYLQGRRVKHAAFSHVVNSAFIAVCFDPAAKEYSTRVDRKGIIVVWDTRKPNIPEKVLVCDTSPTYCCFCPFKSHLLFVGTEDGCVLAFDLKESNSNHQVLALEKGPETALRSATYNTGCLNDCHASSIVCIAPVTTGNSDSLVNDDSIPDALNTGTAFQLASLEELGYLCIWIVIESNKELDVETDLGLSPHGKVKMIKSIRICVPSPSRPNYTDLCFRVSSVVFSPSDANHFYVGTDTGHIAHLTQFAHGQNKKIQYLSNGSEYLSSISSMDIEYLPDFSKTLLLAGFEDGTLELYILGRKSPVISWPYSTDGRGIKLCKWSTCRCSVFYVLDNLNRLHIWDLIIQTSAPIKTENMGDKKLMHFCVSKPNLKKDFLKTKPEIAFIYSAINDKERASVEVHSLSAHFSNPVDNENEQLIELLHGFM